MAMRSKREVEKKLEENSVFYDDNMQSKWPGMRYEEGVEAALRWVLGDEEDPLEE